MRRICFAILLMVVVSAITVAQKNKTNAEASDSASAKKQGRQIDLQSDTQLTAQLQSALDTRHAKVGDRVILKTAEAVRQDGNVIIPKGAQLLGRVTDIQKETESTGESHISLLFDRLRSGSSETPITASILSITRAQTQSNKQGLDSDLMNQSSATARSTSPSRNNGGGGLLGGVGSAVGGVVNTTTSTVGNVAGTTTNAVGSTVGSTSNAAGNTLRGLQITQSSSASAQGGSTLSLTGGNLRLDSGTSFTLSVSNSASVGNP